MREIRNYWCHQTFIDFAYEKILNLHVNIKTCVKDFYVTLLRLRLHKKILNKLDYKLIQYLEENSFNLNIPRYVDTFEEEEMVNIEEVQKNIKDIENELKTVQQQMKQYLQELGL